MTEPDETPLATLREEVAFVLWCANQGYLLAEDRAIVTNHFLDPIESLHPDDAEERPGWLSMADAVIEALAPVVAAARADEREQAVQVARGERDGHLTSPGLDRAWVAGWHSATDHIAARIARGDRRG